MKKVIVLIAMALIVSGCTPQSNVPAGNKGNSSTGQSSNPTTSYTLAQVAQHNSMKDCWIAIDGNVYNATAYLPQHPNMQIIDGCGKDGSAMFAGQGKHQGPQAQAMLVQLKIGTLSM